MREVIRLQTEYRASKPVEYVTFTNERDPLSPVIAIQWRVKRVKQVPEGWNYVVGDCITNAHSALDHAMLATAARFADLSEDDERSTYFPLFTEPSKWSRWAKRQHVPYDAETMEVLEQRQPFNTHPDEPESAPLAKLHRSSAVVKHRRLLTHAVSEPEIHIEATPPLEVLNKRTSREPLRDGLTLATIKFRRPRDANYVDINFEAGYQEMLVLDDGETEPLALALFSMWQAAFYAVADLMGPIANDTDRYFAGATFEAEKENHRQVLRSFISERTWERWREAGALAALGVDD